MQQFTKIDNIDINSMIQDLMISIKLTAQIYDLDGIELLRKSLKDIIFNDDYTDITRKHGCRSRVLSHSKDEYFNMILAVINLKDGLPMVGNNYMMKEENTDFLINMACYNVLKKYLDKTFVRVQEDQQFEGQNVKFYSPSEELKKSIISGKQNKVSYSSYSFNELSVYSSVGKSRTNQEDSYYIGVHPNDSNFKIMVVADGMGGYENGEVASNIAALELMNWFDTLNSQEFYNRDNQNLANLLARKIRDINNKICNNIKDGGTTLCVAIIKNNSIVMCNIGDSQGYIFEDGILKYETTPDNITKSPDIPSEVARFHKNNNAITNFLGKVDGEVIRPNISIVECPLRKFKTYRVVLCSDGVVDCISKRNIVKIVNNSEDPSKALVEYAVSNTSYFQDELSLLNRRDKNKAIFLYNSGQINNMIEEGKDNTTALNGIVRR